MRKTSLSILAFLLTSSVFRLFATTPDSLSILPYAFAEETLPVATFEPALAGKIAGVQVFGQSGQSGAVQRIVIRGNSSWLDTKATPLYVLDGIALPLNYTAYPAELSNNIWNTLSPGDIESIVVLKDGFSTAVYGTDGANGVILIRTKRGKGKKFNLNFRTNTGFSPGFAFRNSEKASPQEQKQLMYETFYNSYLHSYDPQGADAKARAETARRLNEDSRGLFNWEKAIYRTPVYQNYNLDISGHSKNTRYYVSASYTKDPGMVRTNNLDRWSIRANLSQKFLKIFEWNSAVFYSSVNMDGMDDRYGQDNLFYTERNLLFDFWHPDNSNGSPFTDAYTGYVYNPLYYSQFRDMRSRTERLHLNESLTAVPLKGLTISTRLGYDHLRTSEYIRFAPEHFTGRADNGKLKENTRKTPQLSSYTTASWEQTLRQNHFIRLSAVLRFDRNGFLADHREGFGFASGNTAGVDECKTITEPLRADQQKYNRAFIGEIAYNYRNKYTLSGNIRTDNNELYCNYYETYTSYGGTTIYFQIPSYIRESGKNAGWSAAATWNIKEESFLRNLKAVSGLNLTASHGENRHSKADYILLSRTDETYKLTDITLNGAFLNNRLSFSAAYFLTNYNNLNYPTDSKNPIQERSFVMRNTGFEFTLAANILQKNDWQWNVSLNLATSDRKLTRHSWSEKDFLFVDAENMAAASGQVYYFWSKGYSPATFYGKEYAGVDPETGDPLWYLNGENNRPGDPYQEIEGRPVTRNKYSANFVVIGCADPKIYGGINSDLSWRGLSLFMNFTYSLGGDVYDLRADNMSNAGLLRVQSKKSLSRWQKAGDITDTPQANLYNYDQFGGSNSRWICKNNYLRLKNLNLAYTFPQQFTKKAGISTLKVYFSAYNLFTIARDNDFDPEKGVSGAVTWRLPQRRTYSFGIEIGI